MTRMTIVCDGKGIITNKELVEEYNLMKEYIDENFGHRYHVWKERKERKENEF